MDSITITQSDAEKVIKEAIEQAHQFDWTGWRLPIFVNEDGSLEVANWLSDGSWQPDAVELPLKITAWCMSSIEGTYTDEDGNDIYNEEDFEWEVENRVDFEIKKLKERLSQEIELKIQIEA